MNRQCKDSEGGLLGFTSDAYVSSLTFTFIDLAEFSGSVLTSLRATVHTFHPKGYIMPLGIALSKQ